MLLLLLYDSKQKTQNISTFYIYNGEYLSSGKQKKCKVHEQFINRKRSLCYSDLMKTRKESFLFVF